ncbi:MAG TPA: AfsR/SARP family transcriptional regulator [Pseudonocardiaceae bacterium]|jgi:DNA-binding SARP family transcriptional activator|nr:AfsR/SARP family transcriptional regulator [Pseudonocardiaceae bacterium]
MHITVLGPLSIRDGDVEVAPTAPKPRQVLAALLLNDTHMVTATTLMNELWDGSAPRSAQNTLQTYVVHLRRTFAERLGERRAVIARELLRTAPGGYALDIASDTFDLREFTRLDVSARQAMRDGDARAALDLLCRALALWRGTALADVEHGPLLRAKVAALDDARLATVQLYLEAQLSVGRHREMLSDLATLAVRHPAHERLHALYMTALYRSGHRMRALEVFTRFCDHQRRELQASPSAGLLDLHRAILAADPTV